MKDSNNLFANLFAFVLSALPYLVTILGSGAVTAYITHRGVINTNFASWGQKISDEVREDLRKELNESEACRKKLEEELKETNRRLDRFSDNIAPFVRKVVKLCVLLLKNGPRHIQEQVNEIHAEAKRLEELFCVPPEAQDPAQPRAP